MDGSTRTWKTLVPVLFLVCHVRQPGGGRKETAVEVERARDLYQRGHGRGPGPAHQVPVQQRVGQVVPSGIPVDTML